MLYIAYLKFWVFVCVEIGADIIMNQLSHKLKLLGEDTQMVIIYLICGVPLLTNTSVLWAGSVDNEQTHPSSCWNLTLIQTNGVK